jgi:catechol 2,3-dioxygenase-like lactoylglutathione lyase family enzyme
VSSVSLPRFHHVALTVTDLDVSIPWYEKVFDIEYRTEIPHQGGTGMLLADPERQLMIVLHRHDTNAGRSFSERETGLDHVGLRVASRSELEAWQTHLVDVGVEQVETADRPCTQSPITDAPYASVLVFRDPDNIQLELFAPPAS